MAIEDSIRNKPGNTLRVLSANLYSGRASADALVEVVNEYDIDVVCAQELTRSLADRLASVLPHGELNHAGIHRGNGIAARRPVRIRKIAMPKRDGWRAILEPDHWRRLESEIDIVNVHVSGPHTWPYFPNPVRRSEQLRAVFADRRQRQGVPCAILGDFNASPAWPVYRKMAKRFTDAAVANDAASPTWPVLPTFGFAGLIRIDHCFTDRLAASAVRVIAIAGSDHGGLLVDLDLQSAKSGTMAAVALEEDRQ